jgi:hypothetical protein
MSKLTDAQITERDRKRNIGEELLQAVREIKAGKTGRMIQADTSHKSTAEVEALRQALIEGERSGAPKPFDFAAFVGRKRAQ